jgi:hypothetical protein
MRSWFALACLATVAATAPAHAALWCGFHDKTGAVVKCGFLTAADCHSKLGSKNTICMPDPEFASRFATPAGHWHGANRGG